MAGVDDTIGEWIKRAEHSGELQRGRFWGKPFDLDDGLEHTPAKLRMAYRMLKQAGYIPHEVEMLNTLADIKEQLGSVTDPDTQRTLETQASELEARLAVVIEKAART